MTAYWARWLAWITGSSIEPVRSRFLRLEHLAERYRLDGRLPPSVLRLLRRVVGLRMRHMYETGLAPVRPVIGGAKTGANGPVGTVGSRRLATCRPLDQSFADLAHDFAIPVIQLLEEGDAEPFVVEQAGNALVAGIPIARRASALDALVSGLNGSGWCLTWHDGSRSGTVALGTARRHRVVRTAREWALFRPFAWGGLAVGGGQAIRVTFWDIGTSGQLELVGTRGHERFDPDSAATTEIIEGRSYPSRSAFPVGHDLETLAEPVDVVYTWVDGSDPTWQESFLEWSTRLGRNVDEVALDPARYRSRDELRYSLRSLYYFCGWVRNIYVVTAGQVPEWLTEMDDIRIVDHSEILPADALPTFNSHSIESALHHIDGLAEHFIYFNDDMFVGRPIRPEVFFTPNGLARLFQSGARVPGAEDIDTLAVDTAAIRGRELLASRFGRVVADKPLHSPYPLRRSVMYELEAEFPEIIKRTAYSRFRSPSDLSIAASFAQHYGFATGRGVLGGIETEYVHVESGRLDWHLDRIRLGRDLDTFCINETEHQGGDVEGRERKISQFFEEYFPLAAPWESDRYTPSGQKA